MSEVGCLGSTILRVDAPSCPTARWYDTVAYAYRHVMHWCLATLQNNAAQRNVLFRNENFSKCGALQEQMINDWFWSYVAPIIHKTYSDIIQAFLNVFCFMISWEEQFLHKPESVMIKMIIVWHQYDHFDLKMLLFFLNVILLRWFVVKWSKTHQYSDANLSLLFLENSSDTGKKKDQIDPQPLRIFQNVVYKT